MGRSIYTKLVGIILVLILSLVAVMGVFLTQSVRNFYLSDFYNQMNFAFSDKSFASDLYNAADGDNAPYHLSEVMRVYSSRFGIDNSDRYFFILDGNSGKIIVGSSDELGKSLPVSANILAAISGKNGYESDPALDYMDVAVPIEGSGGTYIIYIYDDKDAVTDLSGQLNKMIVRSGGIGLIISLVLVLFLAKTLVSPIQSLTRAAEKVASGDFSEKPQNSSGDEIGVLTRTFNEMATQLEDNIDSLKKSEQMRKDFVANVSHELRTPITSVKSYAETLDESYSMIDDATRTRFLGVIVKESDRMANIVGDLLLLSKMDAGSYSFNFEPFSFADSLKSLYTAQLLNAKSRKQNFTLDIRDEMPLINGDRQRIEQVVLNLVTNAIKYTPEGGEINMIAGCREDKLWCTVKDNGIGIPKTDIPHIFERFYRVDKARSRESGGTGLGLSIAYEIAQRHGGTIEVKSKKGKGTAFTLYLPIGGPDS